MGTTGGEWPRSAVEEEGSGADSLHAISFVFQADIYISVNIIHGYFSFSFTGLSMDSLVLKRIKSNF